MVGIFFSIKAPHCGRFEAVTVNDTSYFYLNSSIWLFLFIEICWISNVIFSYGDDVNLPIAKRAL